MSFSVQYVPSFGKDLKKLSKKYPSLKKEFAALVDSLEKEPFSGQSNFSKVLNFGKVGQ